jgi:hypothetical protein
MSFEKENAHGEQDRGRERREEEEIRDEDRWIDNATSSEKPMPASTVAAKPIRPYDMETYLGAGLQLIPLHRWDAQDRDRKGRARPRGKTPRDNMWSVKDYDSRAVLDDAGKSNTNVGVRLPADVMVLDVDPRNFGEGHDRLAELVAATGLDLSTAPHTITGSGGDHFWFRKPADVTLLDSLQDFPGIEFKSYGRQVVAAGSIHPCGRHYEWDDLAPALGEMPPLPDSLLRLIRRPVRAHGDAAGLGELTPEMLAETLEQLDPEDFQDHDDWLNLMMACHHATAGEGRQEFIDWSTGDAKYADDASIIGRRWDSLHLSPTGGKRGRPVTVKYLHKVVQDNGGEVARVQPEDDFEEYEAPEAEGAGVDDNLLREPPKAEGKDAILEQMNAQHCVVMENGKFRVFTEEFDPVLGRSFFQRSTKDDFQNLYCNLLVERANDKPASRAQFWLMHPKRRQYKGIIFDPTRDHEGWLNLWRGWAVEPKRSDWSLLRELIRDVLTDGDAACYEYVLNWMAFMFQHPGEVAEVAIAFRGAKGTGKGTLGRTLAKLAGTSGLHISSPGHLVGRFNSHLQNCVCLFADEAFWAGDKAGESVLKQLVTEPTLTYEGKGRDAVMGRNYVHIVMASNNDWVVPAGMDGERRFAVFNVNERRRGDKAFFRALNRQLDQGGYGGLLYDMLKRDISEWHPRDDVPQTEALAEQIGRSQTPEESWWDSLLDTGVMPNFFSQEEPMSDTFESQFWHERAIELDKDDLHANYVAHAKMLGARATDKKGLAMRLMKKAGISALQVSLGGGRRAWRWVVPQLDEARAIWAKSAGRG